MMPMIYPSCVVALLSTVALGKSNFMEKVTQICNDLDDPIEYSLFVSIGVDYFQNEFPMNGIHTWMPSKIVCIWTRRP